ncbi:MAG: NUDIX domain-containing protein, partial [Alphaproteobacteria bacterium]
HRHGVAFWLTQPGGAVLLRRRPDRGLLGGMMEFPSTDWREAPRDEAGARRAAPVAAGWRALPGTVSHVFTHFSLALAVWAAELPEGAAAPAGGQWCPLHRLKDEALPTVMRKVAALAQGAP